MTTWWPPALFTSREDALRFVDDLCRAKGQGEHDLDLDRLTCRRCGLTCEMLEAIAS